MPGLKPQQISVGPEPMSMFFVIGDNSLQVAPEPLGMVFLFDMDKLMNQYVIKDVQRGHDDSPTKT